MRRRLRRFWRDTRAQDLVEYALATGAIALAGMAALPVLSGSLRGVCSKIGSLIVSGIG